jgi:uncharacterized protein (DUF302 family)
MRGSGKQEKRLYSGFTVLLNGFAGLIVGAALAVIVVWAVMPSMMIITKESNLTFDQTVEELQGAITANGWVVSSVSDMNKSLANHGVEFGPRVKLIKLCNPEHARSVLTTDRYISTMMPCTFSVWEGDDGKVYLSKMNIGLMAKMFGGNIAKVMGGRVARDEEAILSGILKD